MRRFIHLFVLSILLIQHSVWASGIVLPHSPEIFESLIANYNSLSQAERAQEMKNWLETRSSKDKEFLTANKVELEKIHWPDLKLENGQLSFQHEGNTIQFIAEKNAIVIKGKKIDISSGKMNQAAEEIQKILETKTSSIIDFIIPSAYAVFFIPIILAIAAIAIAAYVLSPAISKINTTLAKFQCAKMKREFQNYDNASLTQDDAFKILSKVNQILDRNNEDLQKTNCKKEPSLCKELKDSKKCYELVKTEVESRSPNIDDSSRGSGIKDFFSPSRNRSSSSGTAQ